ncbi:crotonase/enoyl-CoA hydratase family protein [Pseudodonghicola flavimaris]|uniref:Crotonase/enoyl-CoA hydratase family protein n=1 Tax=Pseudodonghicola flavimaris TaxID=3050036 RepID=A0ABT7EYI5_9RHOB|nr:crotonase/enoyl-CoA hydratase family protein [Pseudodonghicola flavimaris]MDK3017401.1 crotonase/enoyl-CoA hydratase family protein [Pseudodonghicola flavimaris]
MSIRIETEGAVRIISIDRPDARNAVDPDTAQALFGAFLEFEADETLAVAVLTGTGGSFCSGFDLKSAGSGAAEAWIAALDIPPEWQDPMADPRPGPMGPSRLMLKKPVIAAIEGYAVAGGMELAAWCDLRVMAESATTGVFCRRWGVPLIDGGTVRLPRLLGQGRANDLILTGRPVAAEEALCLGFASRIVPAGGALGAAIDLARDLARFPQGCLQADHLSARLPPAELAAALRREWRSATVFQAEGRAGAARFAAGKGRGGVFSGG